MYSECIDQEPAKAALEQEVTAAVNMPTSRRVDSRKTTMMMTERTWLVSAARPQIGRRLVAEGVDSYQDMGC